MKQTKSGTYLLTCECCGEEKPSRDITSFTTEKRKADGMPATAIQLCEDCAEDYHRCTGDKLETDVLDGERFDKLAAYVRTEAENKNYFDAAEGAAPLPSNNIGRTVLSGAYGAGEVIAETDSTLTLKLLDSKTEVTVNKAGNLHYVGQAQHTPVPWAVRHDSGFSAGIKITTQQSIDEHFADSIATLNADPGNPVGEADAAFIVRACNSHDGLLAACNELLAQLTGPAMVWGDGRGNDGLKTGLSHQEFNELRDKRIEQARAAIAQAEGRAS